MNKSLLMAEGFWQSIGEFFAAWFDNIPKIVYFLFTAFSSGIDAMQALVRKLAGLDTYYSATTNESFFQVDPLSEFIFGILGIGNSSSAYKALNTVFWSLSIFALIMLVVCTMVAMIKSHYSEDTAGTSPWKYIYTAIKAVLTYAVIPLVMVFGLQLSSFILRTLDNITASSAGEEEIRSVYGPNATEVFVGEKMAGTDEESYIYYDFFGEGQPTNNTPFGSFLFKASAYSCNRVRMGKNSYELARALTAGGKQIFGDSNCQAFSSLTSSADKQEYVAYQIDYAFCNNLHLNSSISIDTLDATFPDVVYNNTADVFGYGNNVMHSFSKYDVSFIWFFYDLWRFNFIVAFGGGVTIFGVLLSIIVGLMTRLVKGAALFLIYPSLLGIAPLDNFKAFKSWATTIIQQILMAFGAIVGINILLLLLPYLQNISFFNIGILDAIISMIILIVGLIMTKDFISMVSGFAGGVDANTTGSGMKGDIAGATKKGASITGKIAGGTGALSVLAPVAAAKAGVGITKGGVKGGIKIGKAISHDKKAKTLNKFNEGEITKLRLKDNKGLSGAVDKNLELAKDKNSTVKNPLIDAARKALEKARSEGKDDNAQDAAARQAIVDTMKDTKLEGSKHKTVYSQLKKEEKGILKQAKKNGGKELVKDYKKYQKAKNLEDQVLTGKLKLDRNKYNTGYSTTHLGRSIGKGAASPFVGIGKKIKDEFNSVSVGKSMAKAFTNSVGALGEATGVDKLVGGLKDTFKGSLTFQKKNADPKLEGDKLHADIGKKQREETVKQTAVLKQILDAQKDLKQAQSKNTEELKKFSSKQSPTSNNNNGSGSK